jgi:hypothetical protein
MNVIGDLEIAAPSAQRDVNCLPRRSTEFQSGADTPHSKAFGSGGESLV